MLGVLQHHSDSVAQAASNTGDFYAVRQAVVCVVVARQWVDLGFTAEAAKCTGKHQSVMIDMKIGT